MIRSLGRHKRRYVSSSLQFYGSVCPVLALGSAPPGRVFGLHIGSITHSEIDKCEDSERFPGSISSMKPSAFARFFVTSALLAIPLTARADLTGPYSPDANTVYLWHFDEAAGATSAASAVAGQNSLIAVDGNPATANPLPLSTSILGAGGSLGFGNAASISAGDLGLGYDGNGNGSFNPDISAANLGADVISTSSFMALNGAFTLEALVSLTSLTSTANREIISMENSSGTSTDRPFQFVITTTGSLRFREFASNV